MLQQKIDAAAPQRPRVQDLFPSLSPTAAGGHVHRCCSSVRAVLDSTRSAQPPTHLAWGWDQTALAQSFSTMGLTPPVSTEWIADSSDSFHITPDADILSSVRPPHPSCPSSIMVGDGSYLPVTAVGSASDSFRLPNVLVAPQMIHNLLSICQFTSNNSCSIKFDPSGLTVKDSTSRRPLLRCDSPGPFTLFAFLLPLLRLRLLLRLLLLP